MSILDQNAIRNNVKKMQIWKSGTPLSLVEVHCSLNAQSLAKSHKSQVHNTFDNFLETVCVPLCSIFPDLFNRRTSVSSSNCYSEPESRCRSPEIAASPHSCTENKSVTQCILLVTTDLLLLTPNFSLRSFIDLGWEIEVYLCLESSLESSSSRGSSILTSHFAFVVRLQIHVHTFVLKLNFILIGDIHQLVVFTLSA